MHSFVIQGRKPLKGTIPVFGAKNHALKVLPGALLMPGEVRIENVPAIADVIHLERIIQDLGVDIQTKGRRRILNVPKKIRTILSPELSPKIRASVVLLGPVLARMGKVVVPHPGGCSLGRRPIDLFISAFTQMGARVKNVDEKYVFTTNGARLTGAHITFPRVSVTGTETVLLAATLAQGRTVIYNAAMEPEIPALAHWLNRAGACISGAGTPTIVVDGVKSLRPTPVRIIPDRIEAGSFAILAAATHSNLTITHCNPEHIAVPLRILQDMGVKMVIKKTAIHITHVPRVLTPMDIFTHEFPGFPTDLQAPMTVLLTQARGMSKVTECLFEGRLLFTDKLKKMGANITVLGDHSALIQGETPLIGKRVESPDIRAGLAFVVAALIANGETQIDNAAMIDRGYESLEHRLQAIGASIQRISYERT